MEPLWLAPLLELARSFIGTTEVGGDNKGPEVEMFQKAINGIAHEQSWCMDFALFCAMHAGDQLKTPMWLPLNSFCLKVWNDSPVAAKFQKPFPGAIVVYQFGAGPEGHAGIVESVSADGQMMSTIEGNTTPSIGLETILTPQERQGDGVYRKTRLVTGTHKMTVKGFLLPFAP